MSPRTTERVDPWKFAGSFLKRVLSARIPDEPGGDPIPWTPLRKPLAEAKVALLSTAGLYQGNDSGALERESAPEIAAAMRSEEVDLALLAPV
jgi:hypothetical protein